MLHTEQPQHQNNTTRSLMWVCLLGGVALFVTAMYAPAFPAALQLLGVALLVAGIMLVGVHQTRYIYRIEPDSRGVEGYDFVVLQVKSRRESVVCRLGLSDVRSVEHQTPENREEIKKKYAEQGRTVHSYCVDILPAHSQYVSFDDGGERVVIRLQASEQLVAMLEQNLPKE